MLRLKLTRSKLKYNQLNTVLDSKKDHLMWSFLFLETFELSSLQVLSSSQCEHHLHSDMECN